VYLQTHRLARVIEDLRLLSVAEVGGLRLERAPISMRELILQTVRMHEVNASRKQVDLRTDVDQALPEVEVDPGRIQQVIDILVNNALRHTDSGHVAVSAGLEDGGAVIRVADTGSGIAPELLPRLFDRFYRGEDAQGRDRGGSGLGLAIAQAIVKAHHGTIAVSSELGKGSVFSIRLPLGMDPAGSWARAGEAIAATLSGGSFEPTAVAP
jgi:two-component system sensor histidine kinase BaeS